MIFISVGTEKFSFDRLLRTVEKAVKRGEIKEEVFAQIGNSRFLPQTFAHERFISFHEQTSFIKKADIIVSHAGVGLTFLCLSSGKTPILFPRQAAFKEHLDNHQIEFAKKMETRGEVLAAYTEEELIDKIKNYKNLVTRLKPIRDEGSKENLINYLKEICS